MIQGKYILKGKIQLLSPLLIGKGVEDHSDNDIILDSSGQPFIPATSFIGVLRHHIRPQNNKYEKELNNFWGYTEYTKDEGVGSIVKCSDLICISESPFIKVRDGIRMDTKKGIVDDQGKFDYEVVDRNTLFNLKMEIDYYNAQEKEFIKKMLATICNELENDKVSIGAKTNSGLGKIRLIDKEIFEFDFYNNKTGVLQWLKQEYKNPLTKLAEEPITLKGQEFSINAHFDLKNSLIIRSYSDESHLSDATHIRSGGDYVIPGSSLKGAIRSRAERILNTLNPQKTEGVLNKLFGNKEHQKGKVKINEIILPTFISEIQRRIKIDHFTGGTISGALFDSMPIFTNFKDKIKHVKIVIRNYEKYEAGLMLLILKDLWTGDLPIGGEKNVGRGVLSGEWALIEWGGNKVELNNENLKKLPQEIQDNLNPFIEDIQRHIK